MFCYQCEQTAKGTGCTYLGVCGKDEETAFSQDILLYYTKIISQYAHRLRKMDYMDRDVDRFVIQSLFTTVTNVNFDAERIKGLIKKAEDIASKMKEIYINQCSKKGIKPEKINLLMSWTYSNPTDNVKEKGSEIGVESRKEDYGEVITGLMELITYGLKGTAAYCDHAMVLGIEDDGVYAFFHKALNFLSSNNHTVDDLLGMALRVGEVNIKVMGMLDEANTTAYGHPVPTKVRITPVKGKAILVSGHDLKDMEAILKQTEGKGINVYTHGEMLPLNGYPELKKYKHFVGNYGGAWQDQKKEFDAFPGAVLMTTNCIQKPKESYKDRIFTTGLVTFPGVKHIADKDFTPVIEKALEQEGFTVDGEEKYITVGFGHNTVIGIADKVVSAVKNGDIRHFFLVGGCDGAKSGRNYYTEFTQKVPDDCVILTLACGKYRFNKLDFGDIGGIPRLLDIGQCNDAYSAIQIASALAKAFDTDVNGLPLSMVLSWYEQKAVCILLSLLHLGIKDIRLGPSLPAFVKPEVFEVLQEKYNLMPISNPDDDLKAIMG